jgi:opacity protein-like surface antigen
VYASTEVDTARDVSFSIAPHVGVLVPQLFSDLNSWPIFGLEVGYILPFDVGSMKRPLQLTLDGMYSQPGADGEAFSPRLGEDGQDYSWELTQRMAIVELAALWRFMPPADGFSVYALIGSRMYLLETVMVASSEGVDFGENRETQTHYGMVVGGGVEYPLGPGSMFGGLEFGWSDLNTTITGDSNTGTLVVDLGYRFMF